MKSQCDVIHDALKSADGEWVSMPHLAALSESLNVHSRVDELRHKRGAIIENKKERDECNRRRNLSFYRIPQNA